MIRSIDHVAVPIEAVDDMLAFYRKLGCTVTQEYDGLLHCVSFGDNKINFHDPKLWNPGEFTLRAPTASPGCGDFCFVWDGTDEALVALLNELGTEIEEGPVERTGGRHYGDIGTSRYIRDPDSNLLEFIIYN